MKKRLVSLRTAILVPFILVVFLILGIFMILWAADYNLLVNEQGTKILSAMSTNTNQELNSLLSEPLRINELYSSTIMNYHLYGKSDVSEIQKITSEYVKKLAPSMPQIGIMCFGDENGNFVGVRPNGADKGYSLMLHDSRTKELLNIYETDSTDSKLIASYPGYEPRTRPWYAPVKINPVSRWSEIYINYDEKNEATISSLVPVFDEKNNFYGVSDVDVKLNGINEYLRLNKAKGSGVIYIVDNQWRIISHSSTEEVVKVLPGTPATAELMPATESKNPLISDSSAFLMKNKTDLDKITKIFVNGNNNFALISKMSQPKDLNWRVIVVIPENDIMGTVKARQNLILFITLLIGIFGIIIGGITLTNVITPILKTAEGSKELANGNWDVLIERNTANVYETDLLVHGFNTMSERIKESFRELMDAKTEIEHLHEVEKTNLETLVNEKTDELKLVMNELSEKEKLASLGSLVSGIAHEINTPLGVAVSAGSLLENLLNTSQEKIATGKMTKSDFVSHMESMDESVAIINTNLNRASTLVKSFKQIAVNQSIEEKTRFNVSEYLDAILLSLKHILKQKKHQINVICDKGLEIDSFPGAFSQIITNLIMNSLTHGFEENETGDINIEFKIAGRNLEFIYSDNGKGIDPTVIQKIFDPFFTTNRSKGGSGLGLNIVYNIVTSQLHGKISCSSELGKGTTFKTTIPLK